MYKGAYIQRGVEDEDVCLNTNHLYSVVRLVHAYKRGMKNVLHPPSSPHSSF